MSRRRTAQQATVGSYRIKVFAPKPTQRRDIRAMVWDKTAGRCWYCGKLLHPFRDFEVDHYEARAKGGRDGIDNLVPACGLCNGKKGAMPAERWRAVAFRGLPFWGETMSAYTIGSGGVAGYTLTAGARPKERLNLMSLLDGYKVELERLAAMVAQQIAWLDANPDDELSTPRQQIWKARWKELKELRATFQDRLVDGEIYAKQYLWIDLNSGLYDERQAQEEVEKLQVMRRWWDGSPIKTMQQFDHPDYGPCPY